jgi:hypothetical protein
LKIFLYLALGANLINDCFEKELLVLGMQEMENNTIDGVLYEGFCAENVKVTIEKIVNNFKFDKSKIKGKSCSVIKL